MNSRERILAAINHQPVDRVPTDIWATPEVMDQLRARFGTDAQVRQALHIDGIADIRPAYIGPPLPRCPADAGMDFKVLYGMWGAELQWMGHGTGRYLEQVNYPFADVETVDDLDNYPWPSANWLNLMKGKEIHAANPPGSHYTMSLHDVRLFQERRNVSADVHGQPME